MPVNLDIFVLNALNFSYSRLKFRNISQKKLKTSSEKETNTKIIIKKAQGKIDFKGILISLV